MTEEQFRQTVLIHTQKMFACAYSIVRDAHDASDCVQEVCVKLWELSERLGEIDNVESYCMTSVRRKSIDYLRSRKNKESSPLEECNNLAPQGYTHEDRRERKEELESVVTLMKELPANQRQVLEMSGLGGLSNKEIEEATGYSADNVRVLLSRGRRKLKELFLRKGF